MKWPVLSRLTWAWLAFASGGGVLLAYGALDAGRKPAAIAMPVQAIEKLAPPPARTATVASPERLPSIGVTSAGVKAVGVTAASVADEDVEPYSLEVEDSLVEEPRRFAGDPADEIVITIDGAPALAPGEAPPAAAPRAAAKPTPIAATDAAMLRKTAFGMAPKIGPGGRKPSAVYAKPFKGGEHANVALIVGGLGLNRALTEKAIDDLPSEITLAFAPYAKDLPFWTKRARDAGHEVMIELPMEDRLSDEAVLGPAALTTSRTQAENLQRLDWVLSRFDGYFGVTNYLGAKFTSDDAFDPVLKQIKHSGLAYIDDSGAMRLSWHGEDGDTATVNRIVSPGFESDKSQTRSDLEALGKIAQRDGDAIGKTYAHSATIDVIVEWASALKSQDLTLAPASAVVAARAADI